jgi:hypothetical protein
MITTRSKRQTPPFSPPTRGGIIRTRGTPLLPRRDEATEEVAQDPASLSATLRDLAIRAHRAVRATRGSGSEGGAGLDSVADPDRELSELHTQIVQLQWSIRAQSLSGLAPYVAALRRKVEEQLD